MKVIVTGASGYIGGQTLLRLIDEGHDVLAIDHVMPPGHLIPAPCQWHTGDFASDLALDATKLFCPDAIVHCAGSSLVGPSFAKPEDYYSNNFVKTKILLDFLVNNHYKDVKFVFSSSAAAYGEPIMTPCQEIDPTDPISPYGQSKLMTEWLLQSYHAAYGLNYVAFRYFNACGADPAGRHGQAPGATHIISKVIEAIQTQQDFTINGVDYETPDGTCVRDYVHVDDLAQAHLLAITDLAPTGVYNLGTSQGYSNLDVVRTAAAVTKTDIATLQGPRRQGDPAQLTADAGKFQSATGWQPRYSLHDIITHAWAWANR